MDTNHLSRTERARCLATGLCLYCGAPGHLIWVCPSRPPRPAVSTLQLEPVISTLPLLTIQLLTSCHFISIPALLDSGTSGNFISQALLKQLDLPRQRQAKLKIETIQGKPLGRGHIKFRSPPITLQVGCLHQESISFLVPGYHPGTPLAITTFPRSQMGYQRDCLSHVPVPLAPNPKLQVHSTLVESPKPQEVPMVPSEYLVFQDVFSKQAATKLPPHRPWDCAIDLLPGAVLPKGRVYPLSIPERKAMENYIKEALQQQFIRPSTSPAASSFFFVGKKDGGLRPCIDYRTLNDHTVKLPSSSLGPVRHRGTPWGPHLLKAGPAERL